MNECKGFDSKAGCNQPCTKCSTNFPEYPVAEATAHDMCTDCLVAEGYKRCPHCDEWANAEDFELFETLFYSGHVCPECKTAMQEEEEERRSTHIWMRATMGF